MTQLSFKYPDQPGFKVSGPSREAAESIAQAAPTLRAMALSVIKSRGPLTSDEVASHLGQSILAIRPRLSELKRAGKMQDAGTRRLNNSGKMATCWSAN